MDRGGQKQARADDPQQRALDRKAPPGDVGDNREHEGGGGCPGLDGIPQDRRDHREGTLVGRPVAGVGAEAFGERREADAIEQTDSAQGADGREGEVEGSADGGEGE